MSFAATIKKELLSQEYSEEQAKALILGIVSSGGQRSGSKTIIKLNKEITSNQIRDLMNQMEIKYFQSQENKNWIVFNNDSQQNKEIKMPSQYFAGIFIGGGSISDTSSTSYHLEIQFYRHMIAKKVQSFLNKYNFNFTLIQRRKKHVLYIKKSEQISDFLRAIQAFDSLMTFEDERINRDFKNQLNRYSNLDVYNQSKLANASKKFIEKYEFIKEYKLTYLFRKPEIDFFELKQKNPYSSLEELTILYKNKTGITKTRSGLNHYLIKLKKVFNKRK